ncbi:MAG TPA: NAD-dependent epimerase/dehydratase family protein [Anaerolineales bacterium]|jgi:nucleoside-diphosphate-sugar epimerase
MSELHLIYGTGPLGKSVARELVKLGKTVRMVNRSGRAERIPQGVELVASDAYDAAKNIELVRGAHAVYQCAQPAYSEWAEKFPPLQQAILAAAAQCGARLVVAENLYMYGHFTGNLREDSPVSPITKKGRTRAAMAQAVMDAHASGMVKAAIGRASDFFGPDDFSLTGYAILPTVQGKKANLMGRTDQPHSFTYIQDFGRLLATLGTRDEALGQIWFAPTNPPITQMDFVRLIETELGKPVKTLVAGPLMMRLLGLFDRNISESVEMLYQWNNPLVIDSSKATRAFGLQPTPMTQAVRETIEWCRQVARS